MTTTSPVEPVRGLRQPLIRGVPGTTLGPIARFGAGVFVFAAFLIAFRVESFKVVPGLAPLALLAGVFPVLVLAPTRVTSKLPISLSVLLFVGWELASVVWTDSPEGTAYTMQLDVPIVVGMMLMVGVLPFRDLITALLWSIRTALVITVIAVIVDPLARTHFDPTGKSLDLEGWHGWFPHKNTMGPYLVFALLTILTFDRSKLAKLASLAAIGVLMAFSDSVTGLSAAILGLAVWVWVQLYRNLDLRNSSIFLLSSLMVMAFALVGAATSLTAITDASGKDLTFTGRTFIWRASFNAWMERPVTGYGLGGILGSEPITPRTSEVWRAIGFRVPHSHNGVLDVGIQLGLVGVVLFLLLWFTTLLGALRLLRDRPKMTTWIVTVMLVQLYMSLSEPTFLNNGWLPVLVMFRILLLRKEGIDLDDDDDDDGGALAERLRHSPAMARVSRLHRRAAAPRRTDAMGVR
ncbi:MAG: O-antigen ligase family protein [Acidimicrobiales bacterium]